MAILDAVPTESAPGMAIASGAIITALLERLVGHKVLSQQDVLLILKSAMVQISGYSDSPAHDSARVVLQRMLKDWGMSN